jgi:glycosyltransferase involved in cell wall biosynthesis
MWEKKIITVVFPAYNEEANIRNALNEFTMLQGTEGQPLVDEVLVIDNNSTDETRNLAESAGARVVCETKQGYGNALRRGLVEAKGDLVVLAEPDGTFVASDIFKLLSHSDNFDMVCGARTSKELIWSGANMGWFLRFGNICVAKLMEFLYRMPSVSDCGCTFRLISMQSIERIKADLYVGGSHFLPNMVIAAKKNGVTFIEVPLNYRGRIGDSKITGTWRGTIRTGLNMIGVILSSWPSFVVSR